MHKPLLLALATAATALLFVAWSVALDRAHPGPGALAALAPEASHHTPAAPGVDADAPRRSLAALAQPVDASATTAASAEPEASANGGAALLAAWDTVGASFRSETPDIDGFQALLTSLAERAEVVEGSVQDDGYGVVAGTLVVPGTGLRGEFLVREGADVTVRLEHGTASGTPMSSSIHLSFPVERDDATLHATFQYDPDTGRPAASVLADDEESLVGWGLDIDVVGTTRAPLSMSRAGKRAWRIGQAESILPELEPGAFDPRAHDRWRSALGAHLR